jgi:hypothetical protein
MKNLFIWNKIYLEYARIRDISILIIHIAFEVHLLCLRNMVIYCK